MKLFIPPWTMRRAMKAMGRGRRTRQTSVQPSIFLTPRTEHLIERGQPSRVPFESELKTELSE